MSRTALIVVDVQTDFRPGGSLAVPDGDEVIAPLVRAADLVDYVVAAQDYHPPGHCSFHAQGGVWPEHCVAGTPGADIAPELLERADRVVQKATTVDTEAYSVFDGTDLARHLQDQGVGEVLIGGLATDYCVKAAALDALAAGFTVTVLEDASRGVDVTPGDSQRALDGLRVAGARVTTVDALETGSGRR